MATKTARSDDFDYSTVAVTVDQHDKDISSLADRVAALETSFGNHERIAATLKKTSKTAVDMQLIFSEEFKRIVKTDQSVRDELYNFIVHADRNWLIAKIKQLGAIAWSIIMIFVGAGFSALWGHFFPK